MRRDRKIAFTVQSEEVFTLERRISSKNHFVGPETVHRTEVFTKRGFTVELIMNFIPNECPMDLRV
jgi:hypothetical protein